MADRRSIIAAWAVVGILAFGSAQAAPKATAPTAPQGPYILADAETGAVFEHSDALRPWYPASTTKLMTVYVAFRAIRAGEATMDTPVILSATAAAEPPSKMGFQPGTVLTLQDAIRIMMVKSANDIAMAVAETIGGSQAGFSARMNAEAARIGMSRSHFVNPHGLPDPGNVTTARDMAVLARALLVDFPEYRDYLKIHAIRFGDKTLKNYNTLIDRYPGSTGMQTGIICASGFNLVASARRNGREVIAVVFGAYGGTDRAERAAGLLDAGFKSGGLFGKSRTNLETSPRGAPTRRPSTCGPTSARASARRAPPKPTRPLAKARRSAPALGRRSISARRSRFRSSPPARLSVPPKPPGPAIHGCRARGPTVPASSRPALRTLSPHSLPTRTIRWRR